MGNGFFKVPVAVNEPIKSYAPGSPERDEVLKTYREMYKATIEVPMFIDGKEIKTKETATMSPPHDHKHVLGTYYKATKQNVEDAISAALEARKKWAAMPWEQRAGIFLRAAELIAGPYRARLNAATMLGQSKNIYQAEIDSACEIIDFLRYNVQYMTEIYAEQPESTSAAWNRIEYRPLEGFVYAITPFNFTAIAGNLPSSAALMGNVVVWKPSNTQIYSAKVLMDIFREAGVPAGVINMVMGDAAMISDTLMASPDFAGVHFTGSTGVFQGIWKKIGDNIKTYKTYPRIVGETGGKDFIVAHESSNPKQVATAMSRGAFEYQGQKCSAASRCYISKSIWEDVKNQLVDDIRSFKMGTPEDMGNFINAVISESSFDKLAKYIDAAKKDKGVEIIAGGNYDKSKGYFIEPTVLVVNDPKYTTMCTELFGPILTVYVFDDNQWEETLHLVDETSEYALTGAVFSEDRYALEEAVKILENAAGNFYINDKPTGAVVGQQPFGGARASGTNDKAGSKQNLYRWISPRMVKETFVSPTDYRYPFLG
ncbi:L-glutamate gamma-semialdehyde dehydrogenase [Aequorivita sp. H23M31]|uniref:L-glutamate gamma-semialdehyde dehydrogenase n=1 Tax=Aequorivita ciconiae TaxID=2494375 RepID=A0A410G6E8_9FLAO|nr:L-glutamate gamma-semialdehyde dehydrogenase [Aequorivita sp. H23M31]QAA82868.1 L-glutamate gamma-semialdehyde dehydrogenase [Aequorivita sp. H23M31]